MENNHEWPLKSIVYQIYPRSFKDTNGDGIGDLQGIIEKINYLKELGINAIWLSPIYPSPQADFGYDVADYTDIDKIYGTLSNFDALIQKAHQNEMKIMMDYIPNHTSSKHSWFMESKSSRENMKRDWYIWKDPNSEGKPPNNWLSVFGGSAWELDKNTNQYYYHAFDKDQPDLNWRNPEVVRTMLDVLRFWMNRGVDGFRADAIYWLFEDPHFQDENPNPNYIVGQNSPSESLIHDKTFGLPETINMMKRFVDVLKEYDNKFLVTEAYIGMPNLLNLYQTINWKWYTPFNFEFITLPWKAIIHKRYIDEFDKTLSDRYIPSYVLGNHDSSRVASRIGKDQARIAAMLQLSLRGLPFIYQGEEICMVDGKISEDKVQDPFEKKSPGLGLGRDPERTPMQWNSEIKAGFTHANPWLPIGDNQTINVEDESCDPRSMLSLYKRLIYLKKNNVALREGTYNPLDLPAEDVIAFIRKKNNNTVLIILNLSNNPRNISMNYQGIILCDTSMTQEGEKIHLQNYLLKENEGFIIQVS